MKYKPKIHELFNHTILDIVLPDKKQLLLNIYDLKSKELIFINKKPEHLFGFLVVPPVLILSYLIKRENNYSPFKPRKIRVF